MTAGRHTAPAEAIKDPGIRFILATFGLRVIPPLIVLNTQAIGLLSVGHSLATTAPDTGSLDEEQM
ncbi:hypothetical protein [Streptomyces sp. ME19-01-6]|uniref:hypothetical protein n=1 Tax=Streptomyces sp. ME19-01-6 TaxID=3028686 RepID=UPI0029BF47B1|nr:hypothetical protein [Streptomyces sp. ME19-01-6]MDX3227208.1 hypothetical protein [Streptomyces sp. ME19-01-6]